MARKSETLGDSGYVHVGRSFALRYRQGLREHVGQETDEWSALCALEAALIRATPVAREAKPEAWLVEDGNGLGILARTIRWKQQVAVVGMRVSDGLPGLAGAQWTAAARRQLSDTIRPGVFPSLDVACAVVAAYASPVDVVVAPESWRSRPTAEGIDVTLLVQRVDARETPLIIAAQGRRRRRSRKR